MKRFLNFNFGLDEVSGPSGSEDKSEGGAPEGKDLFDMVCKDRFSSIDNEEEEETMEEDVEGSKKERKGRPGANSSDEEEEVEDPWAARTKEIKFAAADDEDATAAKEDGPEENASENPKENTEKVRDSRQMA